MVREDSIEIRIGNFSSVGFEHYFFYAFYVAEITSERRGTLYIIYFPLRGGEKRIESEGS